MNGEEYKKAIGNDGYSPTVAITGITGGNRITITDENGDHTFDVMDGCGHPDPVGEPGTDGLLSRNNQKWWEHNKRRKKVWRV